MGQTNRIGKPWSRLDLPRIHPPGSLRLAIAYTIQPAPATKTHDVASKTSHP